MQTAQTKGRILVIEDNREAADSLKLILEGFGYAVDVAYSGEAGLSAAVSAKPDLILSDIGLPDLDGFELVRRLRRSEVTRDIPVIALTAYGPEARDMAFASGFTGHLTKPIEPQLMRSILAGFDLESGVNSSAP
ncbi:response regulator [Uliginosibacterium sp. H3]|uniref:Response regulator n=1 Tax=Uliginosibacterium silvisoli TaxID=3114758 RepID=A0ABU6K007_9RHOO|nr:response regulator [Uliginosibacterium sp. H3]